MAIFGTPIELLGLIIAIAAAIIPIIIYKVTRKKRRLGYNVISHIPLLSISKEIGKDLEIRYKGKKIEQVYLIEVDIINSGNISIKTEDFEVPISLSFGDEAQIFTSEVTKTNPSDLNAKIQIQDNKVFLEPLLLNGGDSISLKILLERSKEIIVEGRIVDVKEITAISPLKDNYFKRFKISLALSYFFVFLGYASLYVPELPLLYITIPCVALTFLLIGLFMYYLLKSRK